MAKRREFWRSTVRRATLAGLALTVAVFGSSRTAQSMVGSLLQDASAILDGRSPGQRDAGALFQTKPSRPGTTPRQRVLTNTRTRTPGEEVGVPPDAPAGVTPEDIGGVPVSGASGTSSEPGAGGAAPIPFGSAGPLGAGAQPIVIPGADVTPTPVEAIPEPDTYVLLAFGIGIVGATQRRKRRKRLAPAAILPIEPQTGY